MQVPPQPAFFEQINYYRTFLHELTHATGHARGSTAKFTDSFGSKDYAREELVAEMGSAFLCAALGIDADHPPRRLSRPLAGVLREDLRDLPRRQRGDQGRRLAASAPRAPPARRPIGCWRAIARRRSAKGGSRHDPPDPRASRRVARQRRSSSGRAGGRSARAGPRARRQIVQSARRRRGSRPNWTRTATPVRASRPWLRLPRAWLVQPVRNRERPRLPLGLGSSATPASPARSRCRVWAESRAAPARFPGRSDCC
jgi:hypothetical protein